MKKICMTVLAISLICLSPAQAGTPQPQHPTKASAKAPKAKNPLPYDFVPIPREEHGYNGVQSTAILTQKDYAAFVKAVKKQKHWNEKDKFLAALNTPKIDFKTHALVLLRHTETGGGVITKFAEPRQEGFVLTCKVIRKMPGPTGGGGAVMSYECYALVVDKARVRTVKYESRGKTSTFDLKPAK